ncbi:MAG TPA: redox-regulated ATPase YchF [Candidatus Omnitrophota bacterium]|nr:redox-regulated ATPase YchF [Candidatus Omnitrophota bacterium]HPS20533.1 redox-regulated ATPase YchF [Candidatus Omnitrophota bacterium]
MPLSAGLVGLPNVGKSTIFNALTSAKAAAENYPFCTIDPNHGVITVPDHRLRKITELCPTKKVVPTYIEVVDIAGLVKGASQGDGLGNQFLGHIKNVDAIIHVVRCFENDDIVHVEKSIDPIRDINIIETELMLKDMETVDNGIKRVQKNTKSGDKEAKAKLAAFEKAKQALDAGKLIRNAITDEKDLKELYELFLLTSKSIIYVANVDETALADKNNKHVKALRDHAVSSGAACVTICGKIEAEIAELAESERGEFLASIGLEEPGLNVLTRTVYDILGLATFFTAGPDENRAWTIKKGFTAPQAAGVIHSDFERGFICADVYTLSDLENYKKESAIRAAGKIRQEGKEYVVQDGDIMFFKFNV